MWATDHGPANGPATGSCWHRLPGLSGDRPSVSRLAAPTPSTSSSSLLSSPPPRLLLPTPFFLTQLKAGPWLAPLSLGNREDERSVSGQLPVRLSLHIILSEYFLWSNIFPPFPVLLFSYHEISSASSIHQLCNLGVEV